MFNEQFRQLSGFEQVLHFAALLLIALAIGLIMTPAAYHRQVHPGTVDRFFVRPASFLVTLAMAPLMAGLCLDVYLLGRIVLNSGPVAIAIAALLFTVLAALWFAFPQAMKDPAQKKRQGRSLLSWSTRLTEYREVHVETADREYGPEAAHHRGWEERGDYRRSDYDGDRRSDHRGRSNYDDDDRRGRGRGEGGYSEAPSAIPRRRIAAGKIPIMGRVDGSVTRIRRPPQLG